MKKLSLFVSLLALSACGGGNGGNGDDVLTPEQRAMASNKNVTNMNSFIVVGGSNPTVNPNARAASTHVSFLDDGGKKYDLENVTLKTIPTSGVISDLMFHTDDNGEIVSIEFLDAAKIMQEHPGSDVTVGEIKRQGDTNVFIDHDVIDTESGQKQIDIPVKYISYAENYNLKYSDFGVLRMDVSGTGIAELKDYGVYDMPFAGGYDEKNINNEQMNNLVQNGNIVFTGLAKGQVSYHDWTKGFDGEGVDVMLEGGLTDNQATLTFAQDGTQTLAADFSNWAKIEAIQAANKTNQFKVITNYLESDSPYYIETSPAGLTSEMLEHSMVMQTGYYGDNSMPNEGVALVQYQHQWNPAGSPGHWVTQDAPEDPLNTELTYDDVKQEWGFYDSENHLNVDLGFGGTVPTTQK
ncbi:MAG: hypothetical protein IJL05_03675 [Alphaproteobacteria bacterium]|nr:hypothetical protein [Alphaproteobacteria bacterium]